MNISNPKPHYLTGHFVTDFECAAWLNENFEQGYVIDQMKTKIVAGSRVQREQDVQITVIMKLDLPNIPSSAQAAVKALTLRDVFMPQQPALAA